MRYHEWHSCFLCGRISLEDDERLAWLFSRKFILRVLGVKIVCCYSILGHLRGNIQCKQLQLWCSTNWMLQPNNVSVLTALKMCKYLFIQSLCHVQDMTKSQFLNRVEQIWIQRFPSPRLVALPRLKNPMHPAIHP